jgi:hypothetical protein
VRPPRLPSAMATRPPSGPRSSSWLNGATPKSIAPKIFEASKGKKNCVQDVLLNNRWIADISVKLYSGSRLPVRQALGISSGHCAQPDSDDTIIWTLTTAGTYTTHSAYNAQFIGSIPCSFINIVWKTWAPPKCRFFA